MGLNYERGFTALRAALAPEQHEEFDTVHRAFQEIRDAERKFGETPITRHERTRLYAQMLKLATTCNPSFDLNKAVFGEYI